MKNSGLIISAVVLAALGGALWWSNKDKEKEATQPAKDAPPKILTLTEGDIQRLDLKKRANEPVVVQRNQSGKWEISAPKAFLADQEAANTLAAAAASVTSDKLVDDKPSDIKQFGLDAPSFEIDIKLKSGQVKKLILGDDTATGSSTYARLDGDPRVFTVASFVRTGLAKEVKDLRDKRLLTFDQDKISRVELASKKSSVEFGRSKDEWQILKPKPLRADGLQVEELVRKLKDAKMDLTASDEVVAQAAASFAAGAPIATVKVTDASGTQQLEVRKKGDDYFGKSSAVEGVHKLTADIGAGLDKSLDDFRNKKLFDFGFSEPTKIDIHDGGKSYSFQKGGDKWFAAGKEMDNTSVQALLDKLRDVSASKFVETGFGTSNLDIAVTSNNGKRTEKVMFSRSGDKFVAQRENEPSLYEMESKSVDDLTKAAGDVKPPPPSAKK